MENRIGGLRVPIAGLAAVAVVGAMVIASIADGGRGGAFEATMVEAPGGATEHRLDADAPLAAMETEVAEQPERGATSTAEPAKEPRVTDHEYMRHVCLATAAFQRSFDDATRGIQPANAEEALRALVGALAGPLETLANDLEAGDAPNDLEDWHRDAVQRLRDTAGRVKEAERADQLSDVLILRDGPFPRPAEQVEDRLRNAANEVPECAGMVVFPQGIPGQG